MTTDGDTRALTLSAVVVSLARELRRATKRRKVAERHAAQADVELHEAESKRLRAESEAERAKAQQARHYVMGFDHGSEGTQAYSPFIVEGDVVDVQLGPMHVKGNVIRDGRKLRIQVFDPEC